MEFLLIQSDGWTPPIPRLIKYLLSVALRDYIVKSVSYQKKGCRGPARQSFFWYDNDKDFYTCVFAVRDSDTAGNNILQDSGGKSQLTVSDVIFHIVVIRNMEPTYHHLINFWTQNLDQSIHGKGGGNRPICFLYNAMANLRILAIG